MAEPNENTDTELQAGCRGDRNVVECFDFRSGLLDPQEQIKTFELKLRVCSLLLIAEQAELPSNLLFLFKNQIGIRNFIKTWKVQNVDRRCFN